MKVVISRKGFDSEYGGSPSLILDNGKVQSLPIPHEHEGIPYKDVFFEKGKSLDLLMKEKGIVVNKGSGLCHLDPDIDPVALKRRPGWVGAFGQYGAAQGHLRNKGVGEGDLFLYFGWFRIGGADLHVLYGYLFVDKVLKVDKEKRVPKWVEYHPHCSLTMRSQTENSIYLAKKKVSTKFGDLPGFGVFKFSPKLILTKKGMSRSRWALPKSVFGKTTISYHSPNSWKEGYFQSAYKGQEFVVDDSKKVETWATKLIADHYFR